MVNKRMNPDNKTCPFVKHQEADVGAYFANKCNRGDCAIWDENYNECGFLSITESLDRIEEVVMRMVK